MKFLKMNKYKIGLLFILLTAGFFSFWGVWNEGYGNTYYSAAVKSMLTSWHNFFFVSFDAGGYVSVDKPALGLWIQAISAFIFGFHGWSVILPESLAAIISSALLYHLVQRTFGRPAGLIASLALSVTPILAAVARTNNLDSSLVMILLFATWALVVASEKASFKLLLLSVSLVGLGFNIKMLQAFMILPALYLVYFFFTKLKISKKLIHLTAATVILLLVSLSWATIVDLTPANQRPYVGSSTTNSVLELALGYNGIQRIVGDGPLQDLMPQSDENTKSENKNGAIQNNDQKIVTQQNSDNVFSVGGTGEDGGEKGVFRLFNKELAGQISWLIPIAFIGLLTGILRYGKKSISGSNSKRQALVLWSMWIAPMLVYFSIAGFFHRYYLTILAPGIAALVGIGIIVLYKAFIEKGLKAYLLPASLIANAAFQGFLIARYPAWSSWLTLIVFGISGISVFVLIFIKVKPTHNSITLTKSAVTIGIAALLLAPAIWTATPIIYGTETLLPYTGPELSSVNQNSADSNGISGMNFSMVMNESIPNLNEFLIKKKNGEKWIVAVNNAIPAANIILATGEPVMAVGGFLGSDKILTVDKLEDMVNKGELRYFLVMDMPDFSKMLLPAGTDNQSRSNENTTMLNTLPEGNTDGISNMFGGQPELTEWVKTHGKIVPDSQWKDTSKTNGTGSNIGFADMTGGIKLYDLKTKTASANNSNAIPQVETGLPDSPQSGQMESTDLKNLQLITITGTVMELNNSAATNMQIKPYEIDTGKEKYVLISMQGLDLSSYVSKQVEVKGKIIPKMATNQGGGGKTSEKTILVQEIK